MLLVTFGVIVVLLVVQGITLPAVIRFSRVEQDPAEDREHRLAEITANAAAAAALPRQAAELEVPDTAVLSKVRDPYEATLHRQHLGEVLEAGQVTDPIVRAAKRQVLDEADAERALLLALLEDKREAVARMSDERAIDDGTVRRLQSALDGEEVRLLGVDPDE